MSEDLPPAPLSGTWDNALLGPVAEINEQMLEWLRSAAVLAQVAAIQLGNVFGLWMRTRSCPGNPRYLFKGPKILGNPQGMHIPGANFPAVNEDEGVTREVRCSTYR